MSLFGGPSKADQLKAVLAKIENAVKSYVEDKIVSMEVERVSGTIITLTKKLNENPLLCSEAPPNCTGSCLASYNHTRASFWNDINNYLDDNVMYIYTMSCLDQSATDNWEPIFPADQSCIDFEKQGVISNQVHTAQLHIHAGTEVARSLEGALAVAQFRTVQANQKMYFRLLAASLTNFIQYREKLTCAQYIHYSSNWGKKSWAGVVECGKDCSAWLSDSDISSSFQLLDPITGLVINDEEGCGVYTVGVNYDNQKDFCARNAYGVCAQSDFDHFYDDWEENITYGLGPQIRSFQITFKVTENSTCGRNSMPAVPEQVSLQGCNGLCAALQSCDAFQFELPSATVVNGTCKLSVVPASFIGQTCPSEGCGEGAWCNSGDNMCYEGCFSTAERCGNVIPRRAGYWCNYSPDAQPTCGTTNPKCPGQDAPCDGKNPLPDVANWAQLVQNQYCSSYKSFNGYAGIKTPEECAAKCPDCNAVSITPSGCQVWQDCVVSVTLQDTPNKFYFREEAAKPGAPDGLTSCGMMRIFSTPV